MLKWLSVPFDWGNHQELDTLENIAAICWRIISSPLTNLGQEIKVTPPELLNSFPLSSVSLQLQFNLCFLVVEITLEHLTEEPTELFFCF